MTSDEYATLMDFLATRFARMDARFDGLEARMDRIEERMDRIEERMGGIEARMGGIEPRMDAQDVRLTRSEVLWESMRDDIRRVAEGLMALNERLDRELANIHVRFDRFAVDFGTVQLDHGARIQALERWRRVREADG